MVHSLSSILGYQKKTKQNTSRSNNKMEMVMTGVCRVVYGVQVLSELRLGNPLTSLLLKLHILISTIWLTMAQMINWLNENCRLCAHYIYIYISPLKRPSKLLNENQDQCLLNQAKFPIGHIKKTKKHKQTTIWPLRCLRGFAPLFLVIFSKTL